MKFHPVVFVLITYGITVVVTVCVYFIIKAIAVIVRRKETAPAEDAGPGSKGGTG